MVEQSSSYRTRLADAMRRAAVSPAALAAHLGITYQAVKKVLDGKSAELSAFNSARAARFLGVQTDHLVLGVEAHEAIAAPLPAGRVAATSPPALPAALAVVLEAVGGLTAGQWAMVRARLDSMPGHLEMRDDVAADVLPLLSAPSKRQSAG